MQIVPLCQLKGADQELVSLDLSAPLEVSELSKTIIK